LPDGADFEELPESLRQTFGKPDKVMDIRLDADTSLAQADVKQVMQSIRERGYYLQLPPNIYENKHDPWA